LRISFHFSSFKTNDKQVSYIFFSPHQKKGKQKVREGVGKTKKYNQVSQTLVASPADVAAAAVFDSVFTARASRFASLASAPVFVFFFFLAVSGPLDVLSYF
jgi:hypothetical protein